MKGKHGNMANLPATSGPPQKRSFSGLRPNHLNRKTKFNPNQGQKASLNAATGPSERGKVGSTASQFHRNTSLATPSKHGRAKFNTQVHKNTNSTNPSSLSKQAKVKPATSRVQKKTNLTTATGPNQQGKTENTDQAHQKTKTTSAAQPNRQGNAELTASQVRQTTHLATPTKQGKAETTAEKVHNKSHITTATGPRKETKDEVISNKKVEVMSDKKAGVFFGEMIETAPTKTANVHIFSNLKSKTQSVPTQHRRIENLDSSSSESGSDSSDDAEDDSDDESDDNSIPNTQRNKIGAHCSSSESGSDSSDDKSEYDSKLKPKVISSPTQYAKIVEVGNSSSESGSGGDDNDDREEQSNMKAKAGTVPTELSKSKEVENSTAEGGSDSSKAEKCEEGEDLEDDGEDGASFTPPTKPISQKAEAKQTSTPTNNDQSFETIDTNQRNTPAGKEQSSQTMDVGQLIPKRKLNDPNTPQSIPKWFSRKVEKILESPNCPDAMEYKAIHRLTHYRAWLEQLRQRRWQRYTTAGNSRYELTKLLLKYHIEGRDRAAFEHRFAQHRMWKMEGLRAIKNLEKISKGIRLLDDTLEIIFAHERKIYEKTLDRKLRRMI